MVPRPHTLPGSRPHDYTTEVVTRKGRISEGGEGGERKRDRETRADKHAERREAEQDRKDGGCVLQL